MSAKDQRALAELRMLESFWSALHEGPSTSAMDEAAREAFTRIRATLEERDAATDAPKQRLHARELGFKAAARVKDTGVQVALWQHDGERDEFLCVFLPLDDRRWGGLAWVPSAKLEIDTSCFIDSRKVAEKASGAFPGELTYQPPEDPDA